MRGLTDTALLCDAADYRCAFSKGANISWESFSVNARTLYVPRVFNKFADRLFILLVPNQVHYNRHTLLSHLFLSKFHILSIHSTDRKSQHL